MEGPARWLFHRSYSWNGGWVDEHFLAASPRFRRCYTVFLLDGSREGSHGTYRTQYLDNVTLLTDINLTILKARLDEAYTREESRLNSLD